MTYVMFYIATHQVILELSRNTDNSFNIHDEFYRMAGTSPFQ